MKNDSVKQNVAIMNSCINRYDKGFEKKENEALSRVTRIEYANSDIKNLTGFYSISVLEELIMNNYRKGKIIPNGAHSKFNHKYYFDNDNRLIITEKIYSKQEAPLSFIYEYDQNLTIILLYSYRQPRDLERVIRCEYDENHRLAHFLIGSIIASEIFGIEEERYQYTATEMCVRFTSYIPKLVINEDKIKWNQTIFPIEWINGKPKSESPEVSTCIIHDRLKMNIARIIDRWIPKNPYALMFLLDGPQTMAIDYAIEKPMNIIPETEKRWNYACWDQHSKPIWKSTGEIEEFKLWLETTRTEDGGNDDRLVNHRSFIDLFVRVINEMKENSLFKSHSQRDVLLLVTDFEVYDRVIEINRSLNDEDRAAEYLKWCDSIRFI